MPNKLNNEEPIKASASEHRITLMLTAAWRRPLTASWSLMSASSQLADRSASLRRSTHQWSNNAQYRKTHPNYAAANDESSEGADDCSFPFDGGRDHALMVWVSCLLIPPLNWLASRVFKISCLLKYASQIHDHCDHKLPSTRKKANFAEFQRQWM